ncbi:hypothetical protein [Stanieria cyanosphaera]|nr:hypothetical protein [Stanieria cyanosphaera]
MPFSELETSWGCWGESELLVKNSQRRKLFFDRVKGKGNFPGYV